MRFGVIRKKVSKLALVGWLVGNAVFSEIALIIFQIFWMKLEDYKGTKVTEILDLEIFTKWSPNYPNIFLKNSSKGFVSF